MTNNDQDTVMSDEKRAPKNNLKERDPKKVTDQNQVKLKKKPSAASKRFNPLTAILLILFNVSILVVVALVGYFGFNQYQLMSDRLMALEGQNNTRQAEIEQSNRVLREEFSQIQNQLNNQIQQNKQNQLKWKDIFKQQTATQRQLQTYLGRHPSDWLLAEADYLVRTASNRLLLEHDHTTALALLLRADERIVLMDDPQLQLVREALSRDMASLRLLKREDVAGLALRIIGLIPQLKILPVSSFQLSESTLEVKDLPSNSSDDDWLISLQKTLNELSVKWFEVRDHGRPVKPLMTPETESLLRNNMMLLLQTTQFAALHHHSKLYHHSLLQLKDWTLEYFNNRDPMVAAFISEIMALEAISVGFSSPQILESRQLLSGQIEQRLLQPEKTKVTEAVLDVQ